MRNFKIVLALLLCLMANTILAQDNPTVEIRPGQTVARMGETIDVDVYIRDGSNVGGVDVGISVDETCLQVIDRLPGDYLPTVDSGVAFSAFSEINEHDTRFALALTDRTQYVNGDGIFYTVQLEAICEEGIAPLTVTYAQVSSYIDPTAEIIDIESYELDNDTLTVVNAEVEIVRGEATPDEQDIATATTVLQATQVPTNAPDTDTVLEATDQPEITPTATPETTIETGPRIGLSVQTLLTGALVLIVIAMIGLGILFIAKRKRNSDEE